MTAASFFVLFKGYQAISLDNQSLMSNWLTFGNILAILLSLIPLLGIVIFGGATITFAARFFNPNVQVIISENGLEDKRLNFGLIPWNEIKNIYSLQNKYAKWLSLDLISPEKYVDKLPFFQRFLRTANGQFEDNHFRVRFEDLDKPIEEALEMIEKFYRQNENDLGLDK